VVLQTLTLPSNNSAPRKKSAIGALAAHVRADSLPSAKNANKNDLRIGMGYLVDQLFLPERDTGKSM